MKQIEGDRLKGQKGNGLKIVMDFLYSVNIYKSLFNLFSISHPSFAKASVGRQSLFKNHKHIPYILIFLLFSFSSATGQSGKEWTNFRGDPSLSGTSKAKIKVPLKLKWTYQTDDAIVAAPVVGNNTIFVSSISGIVYAIDLHGKLLWEFETDNSIEAPALYLHGKVYIGNLSGFLYALDAKSGKLIWKYEAENQIMGSANYFYKNKKPYLVVGSYDYYLHCIDAESGKPIWKYESDNFVNGAAAIGQEVAMFGGCDGYLHMVNLDDGSIRNKLEVATYIAGSVAISGDLAFTGDYDGLFTCIDIKNDKIKWQWDNPSSNLPILGSPSISDKQVVIGGQDKFIRSFKKGDGTLQWSFNAGGRIDASPVIVKNMVITATMDGLLYILSLDKGEELWSYEIGSAMAHNPAVIHGSIIVGARDGNVYFFGK